MLEFKSEYSLPTGYHEKLFDALKSYFKCAGEDYTTIDETIYMEYGGGADVDGYSLKFSPEALDCFSWQEVLFSIPEIILFSLLFADGTFIACAGLRTDLIRQSIRCLTRRHCFLG